MKGLSKLLPSKPRFMARYPTRITMSCEPSTAPKPTWGEFAAEMQEFWDRPPADERTADEIIGYDEYGLPFADEYS